MSSSPVEVVPPQSRILALLKASSPARTLVIMKIKAYIAAGAALAAGATLAAGVPASQAATVDRGAVVSVTPVVRLTQAQTATYLTGKQLAAPAARNGVDAYTVVYRTITAQGRPTTASGLLVLPETGRRTLTVVDYEHGTILYRGDAATLTDGKADRSRSILFAAAGYATVAPDFLGLGLGPGHHPYGDIASDTTASLDLLRAARTVAAHHGRRFAPKVFVTGFSQGGPAAMGLGRALQSGVDPRFRLGALAPISGPYDNQHAEVPAALDGHTLDQQNATYLIAYWLVAQNRLHPLYRNPSEAFQQPYAATVQKLFDGDHTDAQAIAGLPATPQQLVTPEFLRLAEHPTGALLQALRTNDNTCSNWKPQVPVRLYIGTADRTVANLNSTHCQAALRTHGVNAPIIDVGDVDHSPSARLALPQIVTWFNGLS
jgi:pimeloyl-ACP methyl ester carboxylesterase